MSGGITTGQSSLVAFKAFLPVDGLRIAISFASIGHRTCDIESGYGDPVSSFASA
jgi:hypothetical protein